MHSSEGFALPHGARGIQAEDFAIEFRGDKIVVTRRSSSEHYTLQTGAHSGVLDVHRTWKDAAGVVQHQTVFAMLHVDIVAFLNELSSLPGDFFRLLRPLRIGWLARNGITVIGGVDPIAAEDIASVTTIKRRRRLTLDEEKWRRQLREPEYLDEVRGFPDGQFSLFVGNRRIGIGFKTTDASGRVRLSWIRLRDLMRYINLMGPRVIETALRYAIPPEQHANYSVLER